MKAGIKLLIALGGLALLTGCGTPGAPMVPSLQLPRPPLDLAAVRKGSQVTLSWTPPTRTTDGENIRAKYAGPSLICRAVSEVPVAKCATVGQMPRFVPTPPAKGKKEPPVPPKREYVDTLPLALQQSNPLSFAEYGVEVENTRSRSAGISNQVSVPLAPTLPPPANLQARVTADGIVISYCVPLPAAGNPDLRYEARVYRQEKGTNAPLVIVSGAPADGFAKTPGCRSAGIVDLSFEWEKTYSYWATMVTSVVKNGTTIATVEGENSPAVTVFAHDVFPPAVPTGLEAVASGVGQKPFVDLTWIPDTEPDLAGYNVFRQQPNGTWVRINLSVVPTPSFRDENVVSGGTYTYAVSAVDVRGNQSARSQPATEPVP